MSDSLVRNQGGVREWVESVGTELVTEVASEAGWDETGGFYEGSVAGETDVAELRARVAEDEEARSVVDEDSVVLVERVLGELAGRQQRLESAKMRTHYVRGRAHMDVAVREPPMVPQRLFRVPGYRQLATLDDENFLSEIRGGRVVARVSAPTASGKTRRFPGLIASRCKKRVCLVVLDAILARQALETNKEEFGIEGSSRVWVRTPGAYIAAISYFDFFGMCKSNGRKRFFEDFDVFIFDEPHTKTGVVYCAKQCFAAYAKETCSLLLLSATMSVHAENDMTAKGVGRMENEPVKGGWNALVGSDKLVTHFLVDRTLVLLSHNLKVYETVSYYSGAGCDVRLLDEGSSPKDHDDVCAWMRTGSGVVPRVLVAIREKGTSYNFPVSYVVTDCEALILDTLPDGSLVDRIVPLEEVEVKQHGGRTGRGLVSGSGGVFASAARAVIDGDLLKCERLDAYMRLVACGIRPRAGFLGELERLLPVEITQKIAGYIMSFALPPMLVLRYLGSDGVVAKRFSGAMKLFMQRDCFIGVSRDVDPVGFGKWISEDVGGYLPGDETYGAVQVMVPFASPPSLRIVMHTLFAVSRGWLDVGLWHPEYSDDSGSEDEGVGVRSMMKPKRRSVGLRLVADEKPLPKVPVAKEEAWAYNADVKGMESKNKRHAMAWSKSNDGMAVIRSLVEKAEKGEPFDSPRLDIEYSDEEEKKIVKLKRPRSIEIDSPGGSPVFKLAEPLFTALMAGGLVPPGLFVSLLEVAKKLKSRFVISMLFDGWGAPWLGVLTTASDTETVRYVCMQGFGPTLHRLVDRLYERFRSETISVCTRSNVYRKKVTTLWSTGISVKRLARAIDRGKMPIAQSDRFLERFAAVYASFSRALACIEGCGVFNPDLVAKVQERLPLRAKDIGMPIVGDGVVSVGTSYTGWQG